MRAPHARLARLPEAAVLPDYGHDSLYGLASGLKRWLHDADAGWTHGEVQAGVRTTVLFLVIDGLGARFLSECGQGSTLLAHRAGEISSVFPSTTASAMTTLYTGVAPAVHGLNGWFIHDRRFGGVIAPLPMMYRSGGALEAFRLLPRLCPQPSMFKGAKRKVSYVSPQAIAFSRFSQRHAQGAHVRPYTGLDDMHDAIVEEVRSLRSGGLVFAYYPVFDAISHQYGCRSPQALERFQRVDAMFSRLCEALSGAGVHVVVSADHGFIDSAPEREVRADARLAEMLEAPLFGERRLAFCAVRAGAHADFESWAAQELAGKAVAVRGADCIEAGFFGPGRYNARLFERVGSHVLLMEPGWTIVDEVEGEQQHVMIGVHGGLTADEMRIPLIRLRT